jgi:ABC-type polysaccharide/polyol phosphate transport system ATPase subunit
MSTLAEIESAADALSVPEKQELLLFLATPVKRYSSGMYVRLAFAVAAHLEPEILVVEEVLAVGDAHFQNKCLGKMQDVAQKQGRTVLFVSHNMSAVQALRGRCLRLKQGRVLGYGPVPEQITAISAKSLRARCVPARPSRSAALPR